MNVFNRKSRKAREQAQTDGAPKLEPQPSTSFVARSLKRKPKLTSAPQPVFNLATALPDTQAFRTSAFMPELSARFSMLREQYDPNTKVGKANDDSVLFPKRQSRLNLFTQNSLADISEVESIRSFKAAFAESEHSLSVADSQSNDDGSSVMGRSRPLENASIFGARPKLNKLPSGDSPTKKATISGTSKPESDDNNPSLARGSGRVGQERDSDERTERWTSDGHTDAETDTAPSPSTPFSKHRGTTSSTTSGPSNGRTSTAATSVASESPAVSSHNLSSAKLGRISDQSSASEEPATSSQQPLLITSATPPPTVRDSLGNTKGLQPPMATKPVTRISRSFSASNVSDFSSHQTLVFATSTFRTASPPPSTISPVSVLKEVGLCDVTRSPSPQGYRYRAASPVKAVDKENMMAYSISVQPNDRGKATAMGLFNKPQHEYDEDQFSQRQLQMYGGLTSPLLVREFSSRSESCASPEPRKMSIDQDVSSATAPLESQGLSNNTPTSPSNGRSSPLESEAVLPSPSTVFTIPRTQSSAGIIAPPSVQASAESLIRRQNVEFAAAQAQRANETFLDNSSSQSNVSSIVSTSAGGTVFNSIDGRDADSEHDLVEEPSPPSPTRQPLTKVRPSGRNGLSGFYFGTNATPAITLPKMPFDDSSDVSESSHYTGSPALLTPIPSPAEEKNADSPTLPMPGLGLSGLVRTHLRHDSDKSSLFPQPSPTYPHSPSFNPSRGVSAASTERTINPPESVRSDPWELDQDLSRKASPAIDATAAMGRRAQQILDQATALRNQSRERAQNVVKETSDEATLDPPAHPWNDEARATHQREGSSMTDKENQALDDKIAERSRQIKENLKSASEAAARSRSSEARAMRSPSKSPHLPSQPFPILKQRSGSGQNPDHSDQSSKVMRTLGISEPSLRKASPRIPQDDRWVEEEQQMLQSFARRPKPRSPSDGAEFHHGRPARPMYPSRKTDSDDDLDRPRQRSAGRSHHDQSSRRRSNSEAASRSRGRPAVHRAEDDRPYDLPSNNGHRLYTTSRSPPGNPYLRRPSAGPAESRSYERSASAASGRLNKKANGPGYFDSRPPPPPSMPTMHIPFGQPRPSPRPVISPNSPVSTRPFDSSSSPAPSAVGSPLIPPQPLPSTGRTTPTSNGRTTPNPGVRKRSVNKKMISEPTFISSTSSVPLVGLDSAAATANGLVGNSPRNGVVIDSSDGSSPPVPPMNPRRRQTANSSQQSPLQHQHHNFSFLRPESRNRREISSPLPRSPDRPLFQLKPQSASSSHVNIPGSTLTSSRNVSGGAESSSGAEDLQSQVTLSDDNAIRSPRQEKRKLRKISSEGGGLASKSRFQAMVGDLNIEKQRSPAVPNLSLKGNLALASASDPSLAKSSVDGVGEGEKMKTKLEERMPKEGEEEGAMF